MRRTCAFLCVCFLLKVRVCSVYVNTCSCVCTCLFVDLYVCVYVATGARGGISSLSLNAVLGWRRMRVSGFTCHIKVAMRQTNHNCLSTYNGGSAWRGHVTTSGGRNVPVITPVPSWNALGPLYLMRFFVTLPSLTPPLRKYTRRMIVMA